MLPFLIEDLTPRYRRVPGDPAAAHPNGARGISRLEVFAGDVAKDVGQYAALTGAPAATGGSFVLGACEIALVTDGKSAGPGPLAAVLDAGGTKAIRVPAR